MDTMRFDLLVASVTEQPQRIATLLQILHHSEGGCYDTAVKAVLAMPPEKVKDLLDQLGLKPAKRRNRGSRRALYA